MKVLQSTSLIKHIGFRWNKLHLSCNSETYETDHKNCIGKFKSSVTDKLTTTKITA